MNIKGHEMTLMPFEEVGAIISDLVKVLQTRLKGLTGKEREYQTLAFALAAATIYTLKVCQHPPEAQDTYTNYVQKLSSLMIEKMDDLRKSDAEDDVTVN